MREETEIYIGSPFPGLKLSINRIGDGGRMCCDRKTHTMHPAPFPAHRRECILILSPSFENDQVNEEFPDYFHVYGVYAKRRTFRADEDDGLPGNRMRLARLKGLTSAVLSKSQTR